MSKWLEFIKRERKVGAKTDTYDVRNISNGTALGEIFWYYGFRKYVFAPKENLIFDADCMQDIASFLKALMLERKIEKQNAQQ